MLRPVKQVLTGLGMLCFVRTQHQHRQGGGGTRPLSALGTYSDLSLFGETPLSCQPARSCVKWHSPSHNRFLGFKTGLNYEQNVNPVL